jgi:TorA maturation chaperone TorD
LWSGFRLTLEFLSRVFLESPRQETLSPLFDGDLFHHWPLPPSDPWTRGGLDLLHRIQKSWNRSLIAGFVEDFNRLFIGPGKALAPPYESYYLSPERLLFEQQTIEVRKFYRRFGLEVGRLGREPDDHIGCELFFLGWLCDRTAKATAVKNQGAIHRFGSAAGTFLAEHPGRWFPEFRKRVLRGARTPFYRAAALLTQGSLDRLADWVIPDHPRSDDTSDRGPSGHPGGSS